MLKHSYLLTFTYAGEDLYYFIKEKRKFLILNFKKAPPPRLSPPTIWERGEK